MPEIERGHVCEDRADFVELLRWWLETTEEETVGDVETFGGKPWVLVETGVLRCHLNADTTRAGVRRFLDLHRPHEPQPTWQVIANARGTVNRVAIGPGAEKIKGLYLYTAEELPAPATL
ncbi:hypothetical protein ACI8AV_18080 [Geodermatophilus sp. SYSU D00804]